MRLLIMASVNSNLPALQSVFGHLYQNFGQVDYVLCAGDLLGIGPYPNEVCEAMEKIGNLVAVRGDMDQAVVDGKLGGIDSLVRETIEWTRKVISKKNMEFLSELEGYRTLRLDSFNVLLLHGDPDDYLNGEINKMESMEKIHKYFEESHADIIVCGQSHVPFVKEYNGKFIISPGSVGQPKDEVTKASYVFVDTQTMEISFQKVLYNLNEVLDKMKNEKFSNTLINNFYLV